LEGEKERRRGVLRHAEEGKGKKKTATKHPRNSSQPSLFYSYGRSEREKKGGGRKKPKMKIPMSSFLGCPPWGGEKKKKKETFPRSRSVCPCFREKKEKYIDLSTKKKKKEPTSLGGKVFLAKKKGKRVCKSRNFPGPTPKGKRGKKKTSIISLFPTNLRAKEKKGGEGSLRWVDFTVLK